MHTEGVTTTLSKPPPLTMVHAEAASATFLTAALLLSMHTLALLGLILVEHLSHGIDSTTISQYGRNSFQYPR